MLLKARIPRILKRVIVVRVCLVFLDVNLKWNETLNLTSKIQYVELYHSRNEWQGNNKAFFRNTEFLNTILIQG